MAQEKAEGVCDTEMSRDPTLGPPVSAAHAISP